jgi:colicin import membrane protein
VTPTTAGNRTDDLVPLRTDFDRVWRGYDRDQVRHYVRVVESEIRLLTTDRDAAIGRAEELAGELDTLRTNDLEMRAALDQVCRTPIPAEGLTERLRRMIELAQDEAAEITARGRAAAEDSWAVATEATNRLRQHYEQHLAELDARRRQMTEEHRDLMRRAHAEAEAMTRRAQQRQRQLDEQAARRRQEIETDFEIAMAARRREAMQAIAEQRTAADAETDRRIREATERAARMIADAQHRVDYLTTIGDKLAEQIMTAGTLLAEAAEVIDPLPEEEDAM